MLVTTDQFPFLAKVLEILVHSQLEKFLLENNLIHGLQSGFRRGYSTKTCLIYLTDFIEKQINQGNYTGMV